MNQEICHSAERLEALLAQQAACIERLIALLGE